MSWFLNLQVDSSPVNSGVRLLRDLTTRKQEMSRVYAGNSMISPRKSKVAETNGIGGWYQQPADWKK
jgi:hypothetical protein